MGLLGMRLQHGLEGVEIGPVLGQGSFGCVYKGVTAPSPAPRSIHVATLNAIPRPSSGSWWNALCYAMAQLLRGLLVLACVCGARPSQQVVRISRPLELAVALIWALI